MSPEAAPGSVAPVLAGLPALVSALEGLGCQPRNECSGLWHGVRNMQCRHSMCAHTHTHTQECPHTHTHTCAYIPMDTHTQTHARTPIHTHAHQYTHTHTLHLLLHHTYHHWHEVDEWRSSYLTQLHNPFMSLPHLPPAARPVHVTATLTSSSVTRSCHCHTNLQQRDPFMSLPD